MEMSELEQSAYEFWKSFRSTGMTEIEHMRVPYHNMSNSCEKKLADAVVKEIRGQEKKPIPVERYRA